jgi:nicotinamide mononucleotide transporter
MDQLFTPVLFGMSWPEIIGIVFSALSVIAADFRKKWQYPVGIIGTIVFFFVFVQFKLYASAGLQIFFTFVQIYGWWYWTRGDRGNEPKITSWGPKFIGAMVVAALAAGWSLSVILNHTSDAKLSLPDSMIFALSVVAQFMLDRKKLESWFVWFAVNILSIYVYAHQGLVATAWLYVGFLLNAGYGYWLWKKAKDQQDHDLVQGPTATIVAI